MKKILISLSLLFLIGCKRQLIVVEIIPGEQYDIKTRSEHYKIIGIENDDERIVDVEGERGRVIMMRGILNDN